MKTAERLKGVGEYYFSRKLSEIAALQKQGKNIINLGVGNPDLPPHPEVIKTLQEACANPRMHSYQPYRGSPVLRQAVSNWYKNRYDTELNPDTEILPLAGSKEGILHICMTYLSKNDRVLVPDPGYPAYKSAVMLAGGRCMEYSLREKNKFEPDLDKLSKKNLEHVKLMFVNYPHMPTGRAPSQELFERLVDFALKNNILIIHDNPYSFILNDKPMSLLSVANAKTCVVELNSLSKTYNMAGWRVGMLCGAKQRIDDVLQFKSNMDSGMFLPVQLAAARALSLHLEWHDEVNSIYRRRRDTIFELLDLLNCSYSKQQAGLFVWARVPAKYNDGFAMSDELLYRAHVFITPGGVFGNEGTNYIRISLCSPAENMEEARQRIVSILK